MADDDEENVREFTASLLMRGFAVVDSGGSVIDINPAGRAWLRSLGINLPDDKSLLTLGLEALAEEVCADEMERVAGRPTHCA